MMEQLVEDYASKLFSYDKSVVLEACGSINSLRIEAHSDEDPSSRVKYSRLLQELLAYKRGAVVQKHLDRVLRINTPRTRPLPSHHSVELDSVLALSVLTENQAVASFCLREESETNARALARALSEAFRRTMMMLSAAKRRQSEYRFWITGTYASVRGLTNFARLSRHFRAGLQESGQHLFAALEHLVSEDFEKSLPEHLVAEPATMVSPLIRTFILFEDSQQWAIDQGLLKIQLAMTRQKMRHVNRLKFERYAITSHLARMSPKERLAILESTEQELLDFDRQMRHPENSASARNKYLEWCTSELEVEVAVRPIYNASVGRGDSTFRNLDLEKPSKSAKSLAAWASGRTETPIVCSWELCKEGSVIDAGRLFSKCARCSLAYYCR